MEEKLSPPILEGKIQAQIDSYTVKLPFQMNRAVGAADYVSIQLLLKSVQSNTLLSTLSCSKEALYKRDGYYWGEFQNIDEKTGNPVLLPFQSGQYYKAQIAYVKTSGDVGFYSSVTTFKFTNEPEVIIKDLSKTENNIHYNKYVGSYTNSDSSEKVYSYEFNLYDSSGALIVSSGKLLHNSSLDTETTSSIDSWTVPYGVEPGKDYSIEYNIKTINGIEKSSGLYQIVDGQTVPSTIFQYCQFTALNLQDNACIELSLQPKEGNDRRRLVSGKFILTRASSEDNFQTWKRVTEFSLGSWDVLMEKQICRDYTVAQGVGYKYGLQAYNSQGIYSIREETPIIHVDFEDMFLSDGERQLRIRFNPKVTSIKNTLLESKMDTIGSKYPFFFRNGNVKYKEFPISGLISMLMDEHEEFIKGIYPSQPQRNVTDAPRGEYQELLTSLSGEVFHKEREFKMSVLEWLTNGKPKLFRSPGEGNFIVRLMNTSLSPNDTLSRMLHTFSCTAYEIADYTFENLKSYGMMVDDYIETRELKFFSEQLQLQVYGKLSNLDACLATLTANPQTEFYYKLRDSSERFYAIVGSTGVFTFPNEVLKDNPLVEIGHIDGRNGWQPEATLVYAQYITPELDLFSYIYSIEVKNIIAQWVGQNRDEINYHLDSDKLLKSIGAVHYLHIQPRNIINITAVEKVAGTRDTYRFIIDDIEYTPGYSDILKHGDNCYDGATRTFLCKANFLDYRFKLRDSDENFVTLNGSYISGDHISNGSAFEIAESTRGRLMLTNINNVDCLYLGNALFVDIVYQEINKVYTVEITNDNVREAKEKWDRTNSEDDFNEYYDLLKEALELEGGDMILNAI